MKKFPFGKIPSGKSVYLYKLENDKIFVEIITYGAILKAFGVSDGERKNIIGSYDTIEGYLNDKTYQGATVGRVANRIENARFTIDGIEYKLFKNDGENCHHGGDGFNSKIWSVNSVGDDFIELSYYSRDGESGFPGALDVTVRYTLVDTALIISYKAIPEKKTPISLTSHPYFNLDGVGSLIYSHKVAIFADRYSEVNSNLVPTGVHPEVWGTELDLRAPKRLGETLENGFYGYDHNFILSPSEYKYFLGERLGLAATATNDKLLLSAYTDLPGLQFYTGNALKGEPDFSGGIKKLDHGAFCLEAQFEPNSVNSGVGIFAPGEIYKHTIAYDLKKL